MSGTAGALAILDALNGSGIGDFFKDAINKSKDDKNNKMKATLSIIAVIVDAMDETGKCDGKSLIKDLLSSKNSHFTDEEDDNESEF